MANGVAFFSHDNQSDLLASNAPAIYKHQMRRDKPINSRKGHGGNSSTNAFTILQSECPECQ
jgi:hypothetical protein